MGSKLQHSRSLLKPRFISPGLVEKVVQKKMISLLKRKNPQSIILTKQTVKSGKEKLPINNIIKWPVPILKASTHKKKTMISLLSKKINLSNVCELITPDIAEPSNERNLNKGKICFTSTTTEWQPNNDLSYESPPCREDTIVDSTPNNLALIKTAKKRKETIHSPPPFIKVEPKDQDDDFVDEDELSEKSPYNFFESKFSMEIETAENNNRSSSKIPSRTRVKIETELASTAAPVPAPGLVSVLKPLQMFGKKAERLKLNPSVTTINESKKNQFLINSSSFSSNYSKFNRFRSRLMEKILNDDESQLLETWRVTLTRNETIFSSMLFDPDLLELSISIVDDDGFRLTLKINGKSLDQTQHSFFLQNKLGSFSTSSSLEDGDGDTIVSALKELHQDDAGRKKWKVCTGAAVAAEPLITLNKKFLLKGQILIRKSNNQDGDHPGSKTLAFFARSILSGVIPERRE